MSQRNEARGRRTLEHALSYRARGWALLPLQPRAKEPHFGALERVHGMAAWKPLALRPATAPEIRGWLDHDPAANIGVICGEPSGGLAVADIDRPDLAHGLSHPPTPCVLSGRGWHLYLQAHGRAESRSSRWGEVRGEGQYVVLPPSMHESGKEYVWRIGPDDCDFAPAGALLDLGGSPVIAPSRDVAATTAEGEAGTQAEVPLPRYPNRTEPAADNDVVDKRRDRLATLTGTGTALACLDGAVAAAMTTMGADVRQEGKFRCILPEHGPDLHPSAALVRGGDGVWRYFDHHRKADPPTLTLAEVRASLGAGRVVRLPAPSQARWYLRLFYEAGLVRVDVGQLDLPAGLSLAAERVADGYMLLRALRGLRDEGPAPYTREFAAAWCGIGERQAGEGIRDLLRAGVLQRTERQGRMNLYLPGEHARVAARRAA